MLNFREIDIFIKYMTNIVLKMPFKLRSRGQIFFQICSIHAQIYLATLIKNGHFKVNLSNTILTTNQFM